MTPLLCQEGLKQDLTQPNPMNSSIQTLVGPERPIHLVLKGLYLLRTLRVSAGTHAADRTSDAPLHRTDELLIDGEIIGHEHNALLVVVTRKRHKMYSVGVSCMCNSIFRMEPEVGSCIPTKTLTAVYLPAPFAPMTAKHT